LRGLNHDLNHTNSINVIVSKKVTVSVMYWIKASSTLNARLLVDD